MRPLPLLTAALVAVLTLGPAPLAMAAASDTYRDQQWNVDRVEVPMAWQLSRGAGIRVAVVDTGVDLEHPDLRTRIARRADGSVLGRDYVDDDGDPSDENGHGTLVAGVIAAVMDNGIGIAGIAPDAKLMPIRVLDENGSGEGSDVDSAIRWAVDNGAHVINLSLESAPGSGPSVQLPITAPTSAVQYAWDRGVIVVAASGNDGGDSDDYPDSSPVVLVGATTRDDRRAAFSDTVREDAVMAPGVDIISTLWCDPSAAEPSAACKDAPGEHHYGVTDGTSFAAPHVAAALAILRATGQAHDTAVQRLRETARDIGAPGPDQETGVGLIDVAAAAGARNPPSSPSPDPSPEPSPEPSPTASQPAPPPSPTAGPTHGTSPSPSPPPTSSPEEPSPDDVEPTTAAGGASPSPSRSPSPTPSADDGAPVSPPGGGGGGPEGPLRLLASALVLTATVAHVRVRTGR